MLNRSQDAKHEADQSVHFEVFASGLDHPECIAIDHDRHIWAGGEAGQIYRIDPAGAVTTVATLGGFNAGLALSPLEHAPLRWTPPTRMSGII